MGECSDSAAGRQVRACVAHANSGRDRVGRSGLQPVAVHPPQGSGYLSSSLARSAVSRNQPSPWCGYLLRHPDTRRGVRETSRPCRDTTRAGEAARIRGVRRRPDAAPRRILSAHRLDHRRPGRTPARDGTRRSHRQLRLPGVVVFDSRRDPREPGRRLLRSRASGHRHWNWRDCHRIPALAGKGQDASCRLVARLICCRELWRQT